MVLQERDYTKFISEEEKSAFELETQIAGRKGIKNNREFPRFSHPDEAVREFIWHKRSLFPNNYLHLLEYKKLDFGYLKELSTIDMYLRYIVMDMCLDIEHVIKVRLIKNITNNHINQVT